MNIGIVKDLGISVVSELLTNQTVHNYSSISAVLNDDQYLSAIILESGDIAWLQKSCIAIRKHSTAYLVPVFYYSKSQLPDNKSFFDGPFSDEASFIQTLHQLQDIPSLSDLTYLSQDDRLLRYLLTRPLHKIIPAKDWKTEGLYNYPLINAFADPGVDAEQWLGSLVNRGLLQIESLVDRVRDCPNCGSAHLVYIDTCPNCKSIDIKNTPFINCFTCGDVEPQVKFIATDSLVCPRCKTRLRHIGTDYDRPLENFVCHDCQHTFIEPNIQAKCANCHRSHTPENLVVREISTLIISERGKLAAQHGDASEVIKVLDSINFANINVFSFMLDWLIDLCLRHKEHHFSLVALRLNNVATLIDHFGRSRMAVIMHGFAERLSELVRNTDICTRSSEELFWILLPYTDSDGCSQFIERLDEIRNQTKQDDGSILKLSTAIFSSDTSNIKDIDARLMMATLSTER